MSTRVGAVVALVALVLSACASEPQGSNTDPAAVDAVEPPEEGTCRALTTADLTEPVNATRTVPCNDRHTAETYHVAELPKEFDDLTHDDPALGRFAYQRCSKQFRNYLGLDARQALRTILTWVWFRPSQQAWEDGARWIRCDVVGGHAESEKLRRLPGTTESLFAGRAKDEWVACASGRPFSSAEKVPCSEPHDWRAVTSIKVAEPEDPYPGDATVATRSDSFCESSVHAWLNYPDDFEFAVTWFGEQQWQAGNRFSVCWAQTTD